MTEIRRAIDITTNPNALPNDPRPTVLLVDDDADFIEVASINLVDAGYRVECYTSAEAALTFLRGTGECASVVLDWFMPEMTGARFLETLRGAGIDVPVLVLTGAGGEAEEDFALSLGATDFVDKSRRTSILLSRLQMLIAGSKAIEPGLAPDTECREPAEIEVGALTLRPRSCRASWRGLAVDLTLTEYRIVALLAENAGEDLTYRSIYDVVHGTGFAAGDGDAGHRVNVRALIKRIRRKFQRVDKHFDAIRNYPGYGYRWDAQVVAKSAGPRRGAPSGAGRPRAILGDRLNGKHVPEAASQLDHW